MWQKSSQSVTRITKYDSYYKGRQILENVTGITKWDRYYKVWQKIIAKCDK